MRELIIMSGISGSGKSFVRSDYQGHECSRVEVCSTDDFWYNESNAILISLIIAFLVLIFICIVAAINVRKTKIQEKIKNKKFYDILNSCIKTFNVSKLSTLEGICCTKKFINSITIKSICNYYASSQGSCKYDKTDGNIIITINMSQIQPSDFKNVIAHELAHAIDYNIRGYSCHDNYWQKINNACGGCSNNYLESHEL